MVQLEFGVTLTNHGRILKTDVIRITWRAERRREDEMRLDQFIQLHIHLGY
jgi:hypothetical protein